ncbi:sensor histidine kinase [Bacillus sp. ISL-41]|uniref:sensor histidine kinase n=1 Tax=unclassified Bacillus (in: firmicutes) TaxID=185979 RepID=UPI001BE6BBCA|nr:MULTISPECIES: sensor histidine kinase [unclassified Bacillus (in: firmicutes)]MBT2637757.1 sensor histidine kinase [Bacillus sp. ISL-39]MBT2640969.1 sensor histidine kinase [Bacillus sp. ISL-41]
MTTAMRQILWGLTLGIILFIAVTLSFVLVFPIAKLSDLWNRELMDIPFIIFTFSISVVLGVAFGMASGTYWRKQFGTVDNWLFQLEEGQEPEIESNQTYAEISSISKRVGKLHKQISEKAMLSQRLATEKAEEQESRIQEIISQERNRLARELHDSVSQQLFAASMLMSAINETKGPSEDRETKQLKMVEEMIHQSQLEMRALLLHLRPVALKGKCLQEGIEELLIELRQKVTMDIKWKVEPFPLDKGVEDHLFRILQESVSNTLRHAKAEELEVLLIKRDDKVIMRIVDDGIGFNVEEAKAGSYGLQNMHERAGEIGGTLKIVSVENKGTRLEVKVPILVVAGEKND